MTEQKSVFNWQFFVGFVLVVAGGLFLADQFLEFEIMRNFWPLLVVLLGLTFFIGMLTARQRGAWLAIPGSVITTTGIILYIHNTFNLWVTWTYAWALLVSAVGIGMLIMNIYLKREGLQKAGGWVIGIGLVLFVLFGIFFEVVLDLAGLNVNSGIFLGSGLVLLGLFVVFSRFIFSTKPKKVIAEEQPAEPVTEAVEEPSAEPMMTMPEEEQPSAEPMMTMPEEGEPAPEMQGEKISPLEEDVEFSKLAFDVAGDVVIEQGDVCSLRIEGDQALIDKVNTNVADDTLSITFQSGEEGLKKLKWIEKESKVQYFITVKSLKALTLSGAGNIHGDRLSGESLDLRHSGEGRLIFKNLKYDEIQVSLEGLGEIILDGEVQTQNVDLGGLGSYKAEDLKSLEANVLVSGAGTAQVWVEEDLNATLTGAGSILYKGQPTLEKSITGLGNIKPLETD